jgi:diadenosine tetraphosphate (Ap4A) HIT family hydrolase
MQKDIMVAGFNIGANAGAAAGQTVYHCHIHLMPSGTGIWKIRAVVLDISFLERGII